MSESGTVAPAQRIAILASNKETIGGTITHNGSSWLRLSNSSFRTPDYVTVEATQSPGPVPVASRISVIPASGGYPAIDVPTVLQPTGAGVYSIPRIADGGTFTTTITIVNCDLVPAVVSLDFFRQVGTDGTTIPWSIITDGLVPLKNASIPVGGSVTWRTTGAPKDVEVGWAQLATNQKVNGFAVFRAAGIVGREPQEAAVPLIRGWQQRFLLPFDNANGLVTSIALTNVSGAESGKIEVMFRDEDGQAMDNSYKRTLPPLGHVAFASPDEMPFLAGRRGTAEFAMSGGRMSALALRFNSAALTSFEPQSLMSAGQGRLIIPQIADGFTNDSKFTTSVTVVNKDVTPAQVSLRFYRRSGATNETSPWVVAMQNNRAVSNVVIVPGSSVTWQTVGDKPLEQGWAEVLTSQKVSGFAVFTQHVEGRPDQEAAVPIVQGAQQRFILPFDNQGYTTTMALANFSETEAGALRAVVRDSNNNVLSDTNLVVPALGHMAFVLADQFAVTANRRGTVEFVTQTGQVAALGLRFAGSAFTSFKPQPLE